MGLPLTGAQLAAWTAQVRRNDGFDTHGEVRTAGAVATSIVPRTPDDRSSLQHVIYIVKENRTYDQVFGSLGKGNGDPSLNLFGEESAPNSRSLERDFTTFDNFYADAEVSAQGWNWTVAANSDPYSEQVWSANYSARNGVRQAPRSPSLQHCPSPVYSCWNVSPVVIFTVAAELCVVSIW